jgi:hypothetical protein
MSPAKVRQAFLLLWMGLALAFAACAAQAQTETVLYNFCSLRDAQTAWLPTLASPLTKQAISMG